MKDCTRPEGHDWESISFTTAAGSTPVTCTVCGEFGYRLGHRVVEPNLGGTGINEEGLFKL